MTKRSLFRWRPTIAHGAVMAVTVACGGCFDMMAGYSEVLGNRMLAPRDKLNFACGETTAAFADAPLMDRVGFDGPTLGRSDVAVLVIPSWYGHWTLQIRSVDGRPVSGECVPGVGDPKSAVEAATANITSGTRVQQCLRVAVLAGHRIVTLSVSSKGYGSAWDDTKVKGARADGMVVFPARVGGLYSAHVCQPLRSARPVFWIRDEHSLTCVSAACPPVDEPSTEEQS